MSIGHKYFILYFRDEENEMVGSDSYCPVDGRFNLTSMSLFANKNAKLNHLKEKGVNGFRICTGQIFKPTYVSRYIELKS